MLACMQLTTSYVYHGLKTVIETHLLNFHVTEPIDYTILITRSYHGLHDNHLFHIEIDKKIGSKFVLGGRFIVVL